MKKVLCILGVLFCNSLFAAAFDYIKMTTDLFGNAVKVRCIGNDSYVSYQTLDGKVFIPQELNITLQHTAANTDSTKLQASTYANNTQVSNVASYIRANAKRTQQRLRLVDTNRRNEWNKSKKQLYNIKKTNTFNILQQSNAIDQQVGIVVLVDFIYAADRSTTVSKKYNSIITQEYVNNALNSLTWTRTTDSVTETSARKYFLEQSQGLFDYSNIVTDWILMSGTRIDYDYPYDYDIGKDYSYDYMFEKTTDPIILAKFESLYPDKPCAYIYAYDSDIREKPREIDATIKYNTWSFLGSGESHTYKVIASEYSSTGYFGVYDPYTNAYCYQNDYANGYYAGWNTYECGVCAHIMFNELLKKISTTSYAFENLTRTICNNISLGYNCPSYSDGYTASPKVSKTRVTTFNKINTIKNFNVIYAGNCAYSWSEGLWPHSWYITDPEMTFQLKYTCTDNISDQNIEVKTYTASDSQIFYPVSGATTETFTIKGNEVVPCKYEITSVISQDKTILLDISTFCHENGHMACNFPDLYAYDGQGEGVGQYSLMGANTKIPQNIDPYLRMHMGWVTPIELPKDGQIYTYTITTSKNDVYKFTNPNNSKEYFLIENRQQSGSDAFLPSHGLFIWRCYEDGSNTYSSDTYPDNPYLLGFANGIYRRDYEASVEQADGLYELEQGLNRGDIYDGWHKSNSKMPSEFNDNSKPTARWHDASASGLRIFNISESGSTMMFSYQYSTVPPEAYTVTLNVSPTEGGTVTGSGQYSSGQTATVSATPAPGYNFKSWSDGGTQTHSFAVIQNTSLTAYFEKIPSPPEKRNISNATATIIDSVSLKYTGRALKPKVNVVYP